MYIYTRIYCGAIMNYQKHELKANALRDWSKSDQRLVRHGSIKRITAEDSERYSFYENTRYKFFFHRYIYVYIYICIRVRGFPQVGYLSLLVRRVWGAGKLGFLCLSVCVCVCSWLGRQRPALATRPGDAPGDPPSNPPGDPPGDPPSDPATHSSLLAPV